MGKMLERTDALLQQAEESRQTFQAMHGTMATVREAISKLDITVRTISAAVQEYRELDSRVRVCEDRKTDHEDNTKFRKALMRYGVLMGVAAVAGGGTLGNLLSRVLGWH